VQLVGSKFVCISLLHGRCTTSNTEVDIEPFKFSPRQELEVSPTVAYFMYFMIGMVVV
jgi:hypothetical protein